jgi:hypothetical protein
MRDGESYREGDLIVECGGKRSATPLWIERKVVFNETKSKAPPPLRSVGALQSLECQLTWQQLEG